MLYEVITGYSIRERMMHWKALQMQCLVITSYSIHYTKLYDQIGTYRLVVDKDRLEDIQKSFSEYAMFAYLNGIEDLSKNILIDENVITLDEIATSVYGKINDIERERIKQESLK